ncbi:MAG: BrnA antitoxin family protein [Candidatus Ozemobacteraceae bacterium]
MKTNKRKLVMPTPEEDAAIHRGIAEDPDTWELTDEDFSRMRPASEVCPELVEAFRKSRGPNKSPTKEAVHIRLSREVLEFFRTTGKGWQTRLNNALLKLVRGKKSLHNS